MYAIILYDGISNVLGLGIVTGLAERENGEGEVACFETPEEAETYAEEISAWDYKVIEV